MVHVIEQSLKSFIKMGEEDLLQHYLVQLNGHFEGNVQVKHLTKKVKPIFLYEKMVKMFLLQNVSFGMAKKLETIDQLLSYLNWRDTKVAFIVFNHQKVLLQYSKR